MVNFYVFGENSVYVCRWYSQQKKVGNLEKKQVR